MSDKNNYHSIFNKEYKVIEKNELIISKRDSSSEQLFKDFSLLNEQYKNLLKQIVRTTKMSDASHRDTLNANDRIQILNDDLLKQKKKSEEAEVELAQISNDLALIAEKESGLRSELQTSYEQLKSARANMENELQMARQIQEHLLPLTPPEIPGGKIYSHYIALDAVGGDFIDYSQDNEGSVGILVADASGHGVPAALVGSISKMYMESQGQRHTYHPAKILQNLNQALYGKINNNFLTACYAIFNTKNLNFVYSICGHPPPYLIRNKKVIQLEGKGRPVAIFPEIDPAEISIQLQPEDMLLIVTDGILECRSNNDVYLDDDTLMQMLNSLADHSHESFLDDLLALLADYTGDRGFEDDATLVLLCLEK